MRNLIIAIRATFLLWLLTAIVYPSILLIVGQVVFPFQANGSLLTNSQGQVIGSALIGQQFSSDRYFWSRPSTVDYAQAQDYQNTGISGASNLAPSNPDLLNRIYVTNAHLNQAGVTPTADLVYTSGSGLDPHISIAAAEAQLSRVATARGRSPEQLRPLIAQNSDRRFLGIFGEPGVNVLKLNLALDQG